MDKIPGVDPGAFWWGMGAAFVVVLLLVWLLGG